VYLVHLHVPVALRVSRDCGASGSDAETQRRTVHACGAVWQVQVINGRIVVTELEAEPPTEDAPVQYRRVEEGEEQCVPPLGSPGTSRVHLASTRPLCCAWLGARSQRT
jgi:hypothetical protein